MVEATVLGPGKELRTTRNAACPEWEGGMYCAGVRAGPGPGRGDRISYKTKGVFTE